MAKNLRQYTYTGKTIVSRPGASCTDQKSPEKLTEMEDTKAEILSLLKNDIPTLLRVELKAVLSDEFNNMRSELQAVKTEVVGNITLLRSDFETMKKTVTEIEHGLSTCSDDVTTLQKSVRELETAVTALQEKCTDMEGRMRRSNIRILNVAEGPGSSSPDSVSKLLKEVLEIDREILVDRSHRGLQPKQPGGKPRVIVAKLHYYRDCVEILRRARETGPLRFKGSTILIFPDYPPSVARARSAFNDVKKLLRGRDGVRYGILHPAKLRITYNGNEKDFCDPEEAMTFVKRNIVLDNVEH